MRVLVVGAGIVGASCARSLAARGHDVDVVDRSPTPPAGATVAGEGMLLLANKRPADALRALGAIEAWREVLPELGDVGLGPLRTVLVARTADAEEQLRRRAAELRAAGLEIEERSGEGWRAEDPGLTTEVRYGIRARDSLQLRPPLAAAALLDRARTLGARVHGGVAVVGVGPGEVRTTAGVLTADEVVLAAGAWSGRLVAGSGHVVPVEPRRGHVLVLAAGAAREVRVGALDAGYMTAVQSTDPGLHVVPNVELTHDGTVLLGSSRERLGFDETASSAVVGAIREQTALLYPGLSRHAVVTTHVGFRPWTPDKQPLVGRLAPGLLVAAGHEGEGVTYAPYTAGLLADVLDGATVPVEWAPGRFATTAAAR